MNQNRNLFRLGCLNAARQEKEALCPQGGFTNPMKTTATIHGIRHYLIDGVWMPSVTGILSATGNKAGLHSWRKSVGAEQANQLSKQAFDRGTTIHQFCERRLRGYRATAKVPDTLKPYWVSLQPVLRQVRRVRFTERFVYHRQHQYADTFDALATYRKVPNTLIDFKTTANPDGSKSRREDYLLQVTAYAAALEDSHGVEVNQAVIIIAHPNRKALEWVLSRDQMAQ